MLSLIEEKKQLIEVFFKNLQCKVQFREKNDYENYLSFRVIDKNNNEIVKVEKKTISDISESYLQALKLKYKLD